MVIFYESSAIMPREGVSTIVTFFRESDENSSCLAQLVDLTTVLMYVADMSEENARKKRIAFLDVARFYGIVLVYYGHIVERIMYLKNPAATAQYKFIYSFHMPFFFLLAGFAAPPDKVFLPVRVFLRREAASRLVPYVFFTLVLVVLSLFFAGHFVVADLSTAKGYLVGTIATLTGFPAFNIPLWFLACLVSVEVLHFLLGRFLTTDARLLSVAGLMYLGGYWLTLKVQFIPGPNFWLLHEAPVVYAFYLIGVLMRRRNFLVGRGMSWGMVGAVVVCGLAVLLTWNLNQGPFRLFDAVVIVLSGHGNVVWFPFTALAGSLLLLLLARLSQDVTWTAFLGRNALILFCLNGVFYHFLNGPFAEWFARTLPGHALSVTGACAVFSTFSILGCVPFVFLLNRYAPQLVGRPAVHGPFIPALVRA